MEQLSEKEYQQEDANNNVSKFLLLRMNQRNTIYSISRRVPARLVVPWNKFELNILHEIIKNGKTSNQIMYIDYVNECIRKGIPDRTFNAFRATLLRAKKSKE